MKNYISNPSNEQVKKWLDQYPDLKFIKSECGTKIIWVKPFHYIGSMFLKLYQEINQFYARQDLIGGGDLILKNLAIGGHSDFQNKQGEDYTLACKSAIAFFPMPEMSTGDASDLLKDMQLPGKTK